MYQFRYSNSFLVIWILVAHQTSQQGTSEKYSDGFHDIADPRNILPDLKVYLAFHAEQKPVRNFNVLEHNHFSGLEQSLEMQYWNRKYRYSLRHIIFVLVDQKLAKDLWIDRLYETTRLEQFCCPAAEYYGLGDDQCHWRCHLPKLPFLVMHKSTRLRITTSISILTQHIFTYCFLSPEISSTVEIQNISHVVHEDYVYSRIVVSHILEEQSPGQYWLFSQQSLKVVLLSKDQPHKIQSDTGYPHSSFIALPYRFIHIPPKYENYVPRPIVTAQYKCHRHGTQVNNTLIETSSDLIRMELGMEAETDRVILYLDIAVTDEKSYAEYNCLVRFEAEKTFRNPRTPADKRIFYLLHLPVVQIEPVTLKQIALNIYAVLKSLMGDIDSGPLVLSMTELSRFRTSLHQLDKWPEGKDIEHRYLFAHMTANICRGQLLMVIAVLWIIVGITAGVLILLPVIHLVSTQTASRVHRETIATLQHLRSSGPHPEAPFKYDVFLSYSSVDRLWVEKELLDKLEMEGYKVCYDQRHEDFPAGKPIAISIENAILSSRKTVAVFSPDYLSSGWTMHEIIMIHTGINDGDISADSLVVIKYRPCSIPLHLRHTTYNDLTKPTIRGTFMETIYSWLPYFVAKHFSVTLTDSKRKRHFWEGLCQNIGEPQQVSRNTTERIGDNVF